MSYCQVIGAGAWADDAAETLHNLGHTAERVEAGTPRGDAWVFWEGGPVGACVPWLISGTQHGAAAVLRWHAVYGRDGQCV